MNKSYLKPVLMAIHHRLVNKGFYFAAADILDYLRGIRTNYTKAAVEYWLNNYQKIGW